MISKTALALTLLLCGLQADELAKVSTHGYSFWQIGQIVKGEGGGTSFSNQWTNNILLGINLDAQPSERLHVILSPEFFINYPLPQLKNKPETVQPIGQTYINEAKGTFSLGGEIEKPLVHVDLGLFTYKYNPDVKNLGEFLFRTGTFPTYIFTDFDFPKARLVGAHLISEAVSNLRADLLFTTEAFMYPLYDFSLAGIASYKILNAIEIGAGVDFARILPVVSSKTSPKYSQYQSPAGYNQYIKANGDTGYYSFQATKLMARASVDPKVFFGSPEIFGKEDLRLYCEIVAVGIGGYDAKDSVLDPVTGQPAGYWDFYNDLSMRMPMMAGFNFPAFHMLDVLSLEVEYFPTNIPNDYFKVEQQLSPIPNVNLQSYNPDQYKNGAWRWSVYAKKNIISGFSFTAQAAFDHLRTMYINGRTQSFSSMAKSGQWHWEMKAGFSF